MGILDRFAERGINSSNVVNQEVRLRTKLLLTFIPSLLFLLLVTGFITYHTSHGFLNQVLGRASRIQVKAMSHELEQTLEGCRRDLLMIARNFSDNSQLRNYFASLIASEPTAYCAIGVISQTDQSHLFLVAQHGRIAEIPHPDISQMTPDPRLLLGHFSELSPEDVWVSDVFEAQLPFPLPDNPNQRLEAKVVCFGLPLFLKSGEKRGYLMLYLDVRYIRNLLSIYSSPRSPLYASPRTSEFRYAFFFDLEGWVLFQSEDPDQKELDLTTDVVRSNYKNSTLSKPGLPFAFQPADQYTYFWKMIGDVKQGRHDLIEMQGRPTEGSAIKEYYLAYAPIFFQGRAIAGIGYIDRTDFTLAAGYKHLNTMLFLSFVTIFAMVLIICILSYLISRPIYQLAETVDNITGQKELAPIDLNLSGYEAKLLQRSINHLIEVHNAQIEEIRDKDFTIRQTRFKERVELAGEAHSPDAKAATEIFPEIIGSGTGILQLKSDLQKAAAARADVLIIGETGTGKQLAAEAIHTHSERTGKPFISINCGELSENLLLDTLFGHVKGAFTEAKGDRKGVFLEAHRGTLFLDEIQNASLNVQQALLRAVDQRKIKPLGSDREIEVDVRLICATNVDLKRRIEENRFRSDLYYRLKVITIHTPSLRDDKKNLDVLVGYFLKELRISAERPELGISRGALEKLKTYDWPGNIRELKHCITRAAVMVETDIIQAEDIILDDRPFAGKAATPVPENGLNAERVISEPEGSSMPAEKKDDPEKSERRVAAFRLSRRQQNVYPFILQNKRITRSEYQRLAGEEISSRTAIYDLKDLVEKGLLKKEGHGPSIRYVLKKD